MTATFAFVLILTVHNPGSLAGVAPAPADTRLVLDHGLTLPDCLALFAAAEPYAMTLPTGVTVTQLPACEVEPGT